MKLQHLIVIFLVIMIPMVLIMSQYTSLQIDTLAEKTKYDTALLGATFDTMAAFELNTRNSESSSVIGEEIRDLEAIISTFTNSLSTSLGITGVGDDYIMSYVPAMVFSLYDGYYIYSINSVTGERELKPYVYYTKTYTNGVGTNITISYSLDNYVTIYGTYGGQEISAAGYLVVPEDVEISEDFVYATTTEQDGSLRNYVVKPGDLSWIKYKGIDIEKEIIYENEPVAETRGVITDKLHDTTEAMLYYYEAKIFTELYNSVIGCLSLPDQNILKITPTNDPEDESSAFMNEKIDVIKGSITQNLNTAIYNYDGAVSENYEMPQLNGEDWDKILDDISIIAFLKNIPIGTTTYNNYVVVNSTTNQKYVSAKSIDFIAYDTTTSKSLGYYHNITCDTLINNIENGHEVVGYAAPDFERYRYSPNESNEYYYYYKHNEYADYDCEVKALKRDGVATIEDTLSSKIGLSNQTKQKVLKTYYTAVGRIRYRLVKASSYINVTDKTKNFRVIYHANGGTWGVGYSTSRMVYSEYGKMRINQEEPKRLGYKFLGWSIDSNAILPDIKTGDVLYFDKDHTTRNLYAVYAQQFTITYDLNGGTGGPTPLQQTKIKDVDFVISKAQPTKENKVFLGWSTDSNATIPDPTLEPGAIYTGNNNLTLYAVWADQVITIKYFSVGETYTDFKAIGASKTVWQPTARDGYEFKGWSTSAASRNVQYSLGAQYVADVDINLYAVWDIINYRITFDTNGGNPLEGELIDPSKCTKTYGFTYIIPNIYPNRDSFTFKGWSEDRNATVGDYQPGGTYDKDENIILYAIWEGETYTIEYDANGGSNAPAKSAPIFKTDEVYLTTEKPIRTGYEFVGWSTDKYASEADIEYKSGDVYTGRTSIKLYAIWKRATYRIIYMANGEQFATQDKTYGVKINIISQQPEGENFRGWSKTNGGALDYYSNQIFTDDAIAKDGIITLYAVLGNNTGAVYSIEYYLQGGDTIKIKDQNGNVINEEPADQILAEGQEKVTISSTQPTKEGYTFKGWSTYAEATQSNSTFAPGAECNIDIIKANAGQDSVLRLYAIWEAKNLILSIQPNGGTYQGSNENTTMTVKSGERIELELPVKEGTIGVWNIVEGNALIESIYGDNGEIIKQAVIMKGQPSTIEASWYKKAYKLTYNANGGEGAPEEETREYSSTSALSNTKPTRTGYTFKGWSTSNTATTASYIAGANFTMPAEDTTLYAVWEINSYTITYNLDGGKVSTANPTTYNINTTTFTLNNPTKTGYTFAGWTGTGLSSATETVSIAKGSTGNRTYTATWTIKSYNFNYNSNITDTSLSNMPSSATYQYNRDVTIDSKRPTRTNYYCTKWTTNANGTGTSYQPGASFGKMPAYNVNLYAQWKKKIKVMFIVYGDTNQITENNNSTEYLVAKYTIDTILGYDKTYPWGDSSATERSGYGINYVSDGNTAWLDGIIQDNESKFDLFVLISYGDEYPSNVKPTTKPYLLYENIEYTYEAQTPIINSIKAKIDELMGT